MLPHPHLVNDLSAIPVGGSSISPLISAGHHPTGRDTLNTTSSQPLRKRSSPPVDNICAQEAFFLFFSF